MNKLLAIGTLAVGLLIIVGASIKQGLMSERWATHPELSEFAERLAHVPSDIGDWHGQDGGKMEARIRKAAGAVGDLSRIYRDSRTGDAVQVWIICGRLVDVIQHTPDRCYPAAGFDILGSDNALIITDAKNSEAELRAQSFEKKSPSGNERRRIYWTFASSGTWQKWQSPENPRAAFTGAPAIYKLYIDVPVRPGNLVKEVDSDTETDKVTTRFAKTFLPALDKALFPAKPAAAKPTSEAKSGRS